MVGTPGSAATRVAVVTPRARNEPALMCAAAGATATTPKVAVLLNREGMPTGEMIPRDTSQAAWKITGVVAYRDIRVQLPLDRLLALV